MIESDTHCGESIDAAFARFAEACAYRTMSIPRVLSHYISFGDEQVDEVREISDGISMYTFRRKKKDGSVVFCTRTIFIEDERDFAARCPAKMHIDETLWEIEHEGLVELSFEYN